MIRAVLFKITPRWEPEAKSSTSHDKTNKLGYIHRTEFCSAIQRNGPRTLATTWTNLGGTLSERSQSLGLWTAQVHFHDLWQNQNVDDGFRSGCQTQGGREGGRQEDSMRELPEGGDYLVLPLWWCPWNPHKCENLNNCTHATSLDAHCYSLDLECPRRLCGRLSGQPMAFV